MCKLKQIVLNCTINYRRYVLLCFIISNALITLQAARLDAFMLPQQYAQQQKGLKTTRSNSNNNKNETVTTSTRRNDINEALTTATNVAQHHHDEQQQQQQHQEQQQQLLLQGHGATATRTEMAQKTSAVNSDASKYEIRAVAGEPNYKSVNLTWEVEFVPAANEVISKQNNSGNGHGHRNRYDNNGDVMTNELELPPPPPPPNAFQIFYCELQTFGPQRCRVKLVNGTLTTVLDPMAQASATQERHYAALIDNLRMATRYTFHIRPQQQMMLSNRVGGGRHLGEAEYTNEIESELKREDFQNGGQAIIIPTKGFSAHATQCLPHASEIEVETGPYFAGRIVVDGGNCGIKGDPDDAADKYTMRIDHKLCGSMVKPETNTVETFITVQENLGIFTHSTRRFVVVCSYQSGMQTVRASFTVPGGAKNGLADPMEESVNDPFEPDEPRMGRDMRRMRYVDKSHLVLKDSPLNHEAEQAPAQEMQQIVAEARQADFNDYFGNDGDESADVQELPPTDVMSPEAAAAAASELLVQNTKYSKMVLNEAEQHSSNNNNNNDENNWYEASHAIKVTSTATQHDAQDDVYGSTVRYISANLGSVLVTVSISVILISICIIVAQRYVQREHRLHRKTQLAPFQMAKSKAPSLHLPQKTLPRALQQKQTKQKYQCTL